MPEFFKVPDVFRIVAEQQIQCRPISRFHVLQPPSHCVQTADTRHGALYAERPLHILEPPHKPPSPAYKHKIGMIAESPHINSQVVFYERQIKTTAVIGVNAPYTSQSVHQRFAGAGFSYKLPDDGAVAALYTHSDYGQLRTANAQTRGLYIYIRALCHLPDMPRYLSARPDTLPYEFYRFRTCNRRIFRT